VRDAIYRKKDECPNVSPGGGDTEDSLMSLEQLKELLRDLATQSRR
jgi:hypothetical protein